MIKKAEERKRNRRRLKVTDRQIERKRKRKREKTDKVDSRDKSNSKYMKEN